MNGSSPNISWWARRGRTTPTKNSWQVRRRLGGFLCSTEKYAPGTVRAKIPDQEAPPLGLQRLLALEPAGKAILPDELRLDPAIGVKASTQDLEGMLDQQRSLEEEQERQVFGSRPGGSIVTKRAGLRTAEDVLVLDAHDSSEMALTGKECNQLDQRQERSKKEDTSPALRPPGGALRQRGGKLSSAEAEPGKKTTPNMKAEETIDQANVKIPDRAFRQTC